MRTNFLSACAVEERLAAGLVVERSTPRDNIESLRHWRCLIAGLDCGLNECCRTTVILVN